MASPVLTTPSGSDFPCTTGATSRRDICSVVGVTLPDPICRARSASEILYPVVVGRVMTTAAERLAGYVAGGCFGPGVGGFAAGTAEGEAGRS